MLTAPLVDTLTTGNDYYTFPSDFLEPKVFMCTGNNLRFLTQKTMEEVMANWCYDGSGNRVQQQPRIYYFDQAALRLDCPPDQNYPIALTYYQQPAMLSSGNDTNFLTSNCQMLVRRAVMRAACEWTKEVASGQYDRTYWEQVASEELERVQEESDRATRGAELGPQFLPVGPIADWSLFG